MERDKTTGKKQKTLTNKEEPDINDKYSKMAK